MKKYIAALYILTFLLLTGCEGELVPSLTPEPTPVPTPWVEPISALELELGEGLRSFWIELVPLGELGDLRVDVYREKGDGEPFQSFEAAVPNYMLTTTELTAEDVNFDGYTDFHFLVNVSSQGDSWSRYYVWSPEEGRFAPDPYGLDDLPTLHFVDGEVASLRLSVPKGMASYEYEDGALVQTGEEYIPEEDWSQRYVRRRVKVDKDHIFLVELVPREGDYGDIWVNVYQEDGSGEPLQQFEDNAVSFRTMDLMAEDVDFNGKTDFHFVRGYGSLPGEWTNYYIWDPAGERFTPDPYGLNDLPTSDFDGEEQVINSYWHYDAIGGRRAWCRYIDGRLTCVRCLEIGGMEEDGSRPLTVWDLRDGELVKVWEVVDPEGEKSDTTYQKALSRWEDLSYPARQEMKADDTHTFWVEVVDIGTPSYEGTSLAVNVYRNREDIQPLQTFEETFNEVWPEVSLADVDFDGDMDFSVLLHHYRSTRWSAYYIWNGERFVKDPYGLNDLNWAGFDPESKTITAGIWSVMSGHTGYYRYEGKDLICIRTLAWSYNTGTEKMDLRVTDGWDGERTVVYDYAAPMDELAEDKVGTEEFLRWDDISYRGE